MYGIRLQRNGVLNRSYQWNTNFFRFVGIQKPCQHNAAPRLTFRQLTQYRDYANSGAWSDAFSPSKQSRLQDLSFSSRRICSRESIAGYPLREPRIKQAVPAATMTMLAPRGSRSLLWV